MSIRSIAFIEDNKVKFGSTAGCCEALVRVLTRHQDSAAVMEKACGAIWSIAYQNTINISKFKSLNVVNVLNTVQFRYKDNWAVSKQVNGALGVLK